MTALDLTPIKSRLRLASSAPWRIQGERPESQHLGGSLWVGPVQLLLAAGRATRLERANAEFIAAARNDIPALIAEIERLRAELAGLSGQREQ